MPTQPSERHTQEYVSLKEYFEIRLQLSERALEVARQAMENRLNALNEIRGALDDQNKTFFTKAEHDVFKQNIDDIIKAINIDIRVLRESKSQLEGKASQSSLTVTAIISVLGLILAIASILLRLAGL